MIVALVSEGLRRPAERVPVVPVRTLHQRHPGPLPPPRGPDHGEAQAPAPPPTPGDGGAEALAPAPPPTSGDGGAEALAPRKDFSLRRRRRWRLALITGLAAFLIAAAVMTIADVVAGDPVTGRSGDSSLFDFRQGTQSDKTRTTTAPPATTPARSAPATTTTPTATTPAATTPTTTTPATTVPTQTAPAAPPAPGPTTTTP